MTSEKGRVSSIETQFDTARKFVSDIAVSLAKFRSSLDEGGAKNWIQPESRTKLDELIVRLGAIKGELDNPTFKIAMIGTTSSGKSTMLNALIGRQIAPIEADEMSAGVVSIRHGDTLSMFVKETQGMTWPAGDYNVKSDMEIYDAMRDNEKGIMALYRKACKAAKDSAEILAPEIEITAPLAPKCGGIPGFRFPESVNLQFFDLPGLKNEKDRKNLQIIQQYLKNAFLIVVLNYDDTNTDNREKLLQEIYDNVIAVCRNKEAVLYVLNKVDRRTKNDNPLEERCKELSEAIKAKLKLENTPILLPVSVLPLFYIQMAFGVYGLEREMQDQDPEFVRSQLEAFFEYCNNLIRKMKKESPEKKAWFNEHDEDSDGDWSPTEIYRLLGWLYDDCNVRSIWNELAAKLRQYVGAVIIAPIFGNFFNEIQSFISSLNDQEKILGLQTEGEIKKEKESLAETVKKMNGIIKEFEGHLSANFKSALTSLQAPNQDINQDVVNQFFLEQRGTMRDIRNSLVDTLATPPLAYLSSADSHCSDLKKQLEEVVAGDMPEKIADYAESLRGHGYTTEMAEKGFVQEFREAGIAGNSEYKKLQNIKQLLLGFYWQMKQAFVKRGEYLLQAHINDFSEGVQRLLQTETRKLFDDLSIVTGSGQSGLRPYEIKNFKFEITLPDNVFTIPDKIANEKFNKSESYQVETGSCFKSTETRYKDVGMVRETIPSAATIRNQWEDGIEKGENAIWEKMFDSIENITMGEISRIAANLETNAKLLENALNKQFELVKQDKKSFMNAAHESLVPLNQCARISQEYSDSLLGGDNA